jgi:gamma-glutamylcyclotransferase (GGCT)/AIG2-like uncharacterized protein YtfP
MNPRSRHLSVYRQLTDFSMRYLVFVYGTLRVGQLNDINLKTPQPLFVGMAKVKGQLYSRGWYPGIRLGGDQWVVGEVYDISPELLAQLDVLEEVAPVPSGEYQRLNTLVLCGEKQLLCEIYELSTDFAKRSQVLDQGNWLVYAPHS